MPLEFPKLIPLSGPLKGQTLAVDEKGVRLSDECIVRLCDGRAVAYSIRDRQERPWSLLDHGARIEIESSEFELEHSEFDPEIVFSQYPDFPDDTPSSTKRGGTLSQVFMTMPSMSFLRD